MLSDHPLILGSTTRNFIMADSRVVQGYIDPNFPNPMTESSASIIIYGYASKV